MTVQQLPDGWHQFCGDYHDGQAILFKNGIAFRYGLIFGLRFIMPYDVLHQLIVPPWREIVGLFSSAASSPSAPKCGARVALVSFVMYTGMTSQKSEVCDGS